MNRLLIIHYHLNPGGVTRIIESQVKSLKEFDPSLQIIVVTGHCENPDIIRRHGAEIIINSKLNYLSSKTSDLNSEYKTIMSFFSGLFQKEDIIHVHNLNLGKNPLLTLAISEFAFKGFPILNHAHDFAEDRSQNWQFLKDIIERKFGKNLSSVLYPYLPNFKHATLNSFDKRRLIDYGIPEEKVFLLPNPVSFSGSKTELNYSDIRTKICEQLKIDSGKKLVTYPVRVIRRKNIGEYILLASILSEEANWLVTQPPRNPAEIKPYEQWKNFCKMETIQLIFEAGVSIDFETLIRSSDFCFTTSVKEGFGMVYLEPWLLDTPVIGRDLHQITEDIKQSGIEFPLLYNAMKIPFKNKLVDFPSLSMSDQQSFISNLKRREELKNEVLNENSFIEKLLNSVNKSIIDKNKSTIIQEYSLNHYAKQLQKIYQKFVK
ncbi:hypothetical protein ES705_36727 [subsurface metagenome]